MIDSLAILERGYLYPTPAASVGVKSECPYCVARHVTEYRVDDIGVVLQSSNAGRQIRYVQSDPTKPVDSFVWLDERPFQNRLMREHLLTLPCDALTIPFWLPPLSLRHCFVFDELAVWFCMESHCGEGFHWEDRNVIELARTTWERRLPISGAEFAKVLLAHGMPELYQSSFERSFDFAISTLVAAKRRPALQKYRNESSAQQTLYEIWKSR